MAARGTHGVTLVKAARAVTGRAVAGRALTVCLAVAAALTTALAGWLALQVHGQHVRDQRNQDILAAARQSAVNFTSLDYRHYAQDAKNVLSGATGDFKKQFAAQTSQLTQLVSQNKSVSQGQVLEAGIVRADDASARVLVAADSKVTNVSAPDGQARNYRLQLDLVRGHGRWLTSGVEFVG
jgi:Mce-associated membrane protein